MPDNSEYITLRMTYCILVFLFLTCFPEMHELSAPDGQGCFRKTSNIISGFDLLT